MPYKDKEKDKARKRVWNKENSEYFKKYNEDNRERLAHQNRLTLVKRLYKLEASDYLDMIVAQNNKCLICDNEESTRNSRGDVRPLCVDHCHTTGKVRGLLCNRCNSGLGNFNDNVELLKKAQDYLLTFGD